METEEHKVPLSTGDLSYYHAGEGPPVLYLHPAGGVNWTRVLKELSRSRSLYVPVVPGFDGTQAHRGVKSMRALARLIGEFVGKAVGRACDVVGCSFGGYLALWLAAEWPGLVDHLVLECPAGFRAKGEGERPIDVAALQKLLYLYPQRLGHVKPVELLAANRRTMASYGAASDTDEELFARLPEIDKLTLILQGTGDRLVPKESVQLLKRRLPHSYLVYVWDAAHAIEVDQPERTLEVLQGFLDRSEGFMVNWGTLALDAGASRGT